METYILAEVTEAVLSKKTLVFIEWIILPVNMKSKHSQSNTRYTKDKWLVHGCLEGPESGVYYRGKDIAPTTVKLPEYVSKIASDFTVQVTPGRASLG